MTLSYGSRFTGAGFADAGMRDSGLVGVRWGIECDPRPDHTARSMRIADMYERNFGAHMIRQPVWDIDPRTIEPVEVLWDSPVCKEFSAAKQGGAEGWADRESARSSCDFLRVIKPKVYLLENVRGYTHSRSFASILECLRELGYWVGWQIVNAADAGVPQTRIRLILRAVRSDCVDAIIGAGQFGMFGDGVLPSLVFNQPWRGWYGAVADLIPTLPRVKLAPWQVKRLEQSGCAESLLIRGGKGSPVLVNRDSNMSMADVDTPCFTVVSTKSQYIRAVLIDQVNSSALTQRECTQPAFTITIYSSKHQPPRAVLLDGKALTRPLTLREADEPSASVIASYRRDAMLAILETSDVVSMTRECLARFQTIPAWYVFSGNTTTDVCAIGNGVPSLLAQRIAEQTLTGLV